MPAGRPAHSERPPFGERLYRLREQKGLSQQQAAALLNITQQSYAAWERRPTALKPEQLIKLSRLFECSVDELVGVQAKPRRKGGPVGKVRRVFEEVSRLPRNQQNKVAEFVEAFVVQQQQSKERKA